MNYEAETQWENDNQALRHIRYPVVHNELYKNRLLVVQKCSGMRNMNRIQPIWISEKLHIPQKIVAK